MNLELTTVLSRASNESVSVSLGNQLCADADLDTLVATESTSYCQLEDGDCVNARKASDPYILRYRKSKFK